MATVSHHIKNARRLAADAAVVERALSRTTIDENACECCGPRYILLPGRDMVMHHLARAIAKLHDRVSAVIDAPSRRGARGYVRVGRYHGVIPSTPGYLGQIRGPALIERETRGGRRVIGLTRNVRYETLPPLPGFETHDYCGYCGCNNGPNGEARQGFDCCYCGSN